MLINVEDSNGICIMALNGRLDASTAPLLQARFEELAGTDNPRFLVDMREVAYVSSGGLRVLLIMAKKIMAGAGKMVLAELHPFVEDLLTMSGFNSIIPTAATRDEALQLLTAGGEG